MPYNTVINYQQLLKREKFFIDFESNQNHDLFLLGLKNKNVFSLWVIDEKLRALEDNESYKDKFNIKFVNPTICLKNLLNQIEQSSGILVAYSEIEKNLINKKFKKEIKGKKIPYLNLRKAVKLWAKTYHEKEFEALPPLIKSIDPFYKKSMKNSLASYIRLINEKYHSPSSYGFKKTTKRINSVIAGLNNSKTKNNFDKLTKSKKRDATNVLNHNKWDVESLEVLTNHILQKDPNCFKDSFIDLLE